MLYNVHELNRAVMDPASDLARLGARMFSAPGWLSQLPGAAPVAAGCELLYRLGKQYDKPSFDIDSIEVRGSRVAVLEQNIQARPFCRLLRFKRYSDQPDIVAAMKREPTVLLVAPHSGHHATLLRDTVRTLLHGHKVYVTDWIDARRVPAAEGAFTLDDYVAYLRGFMQQIGTQNLHVVAICQAAVPALAAVSLMAAAGQAQPRSLVLMGGPLDTRRNPTQVNHFALSRPLTWFDSHLLQVVPSSYPGRGRRVYPGFLQHASFLAMNPVRHVSSHWNFFQDLVRGQQDHADAHRNFYDEYNAVMDLPGEYYLDCIRVVFHEHLLPRGLWRVSGQPVTPAAITTSLLTVEGERDDISGLGQTRVAHELCTGIPTDRKHHLAVDNAGHYGIFSGHRWRDSVYPRLRAFIASTQPAA